MASFSTEGNIGSAPPPYDGHYKPSTGVVPNPYGAASIMAAGGAYGSAAYAGASPSQAGTLYGQPANHVCGGYPLTTQPMYGQQSINTSTTTTAVVINTGTTSVRNVIAGNACMTEYPFQMTCPHCHATIVTSIEYVSGGLTWLVFAILFLFGLIFCSCLPFCMNSFKDVTHSCPNCRFFLGRYTRL